MAFIYLNQPSLFNTSRALTRTQHVRACLVTPVLHAQTRNYSLHRAKSSGTHSQEDVAAAIERYARYRQTPVTLKQFAELGRHRDHEMSTRFCRNELPIRYAQMIKEIEALPPDLLRLQKIQMVHGWYVKSFTDMYELPLYEEVSPSDRPEYCNKVTAVISNILNRHKTVVPTIAHAILELKTKLPIGKNVKMDRPIQYFLDRIYMSRIGMRMIGSQHVELFGGRGQVDVGGGVIDENCRVMDILQDAVDNAQFLCDQQYLQSPAVEIFHPGLTQDFQFPYIPTHLYHIVFELFKNSMRAVVETHGKEDGHLPPIKVVAIKGEQDLTIKISDRGGGIPRSDMPKIFSYLYTTAELPDTDAAFANDGNAPLAGFGYGLPLSRLYTRYMGGDCQILSMDGYGTDAYVYLKHSPEHSLEVLPTYNEVQLRPYSSASEHTDWLFGQKV